MAAYRLPNDQTDDSAGIIRTADEAFIQVNTANADWNDYVAWRASNTADPATALALASERKIAKAKVDRDSQREFEKDLVLVGFTSPLAAAALYKLIQEATEVDIDGMAYADGRHPMLKELIGTEGATGADVAAAVTTWWDTKKVRTAQVNKVRWKAHKDIDGAGTVAAIRAVYTGITWPA